MKILFVYPKYPDTFWSFKHVLNFVSKKASFPPLGLLTVANTLPKKWEKRLVDMNVSALSDKDIEWADLIFISAMITQKESAKEVIQSCNELNKKIVVGGPLFTTGYEDFEGVDHFILGEVENTLQEFVDDLEKGVAKQIYFAEEWPEITKTPVPLWSLINVNHYVALSVQFSRGCPYDCEFCNITVMYGHVPRVKDASQILEELNAILATGFRGSVFFVDDNLIGNKKELKKTLPEVIRWQEKEKYPFAFLTEASLNLADDEDLMQMMVRAGFHSVFVGLETPNNDSLVECNKLQNKGRDMVFAVKRIQKHGMQVLGGYIVGFDSDLESIFEDQIKFIQKSGVPVAMVGILSALPKTRLYKRLREEKRLLEDTSGNNTDGSLNFIPKMRKEDLVNGYLRIIQTIYSPKNYYERIITFLEEYRPAKTKQKKIDFIQLRAFFQSVWCLGITGDSKRYYWKFMAKVILKYPRTLPEVVGLTVRGIHFRKVVESIESVVKSQSSSAK